MNVKFKVLVSICLVFTMSMIESCHSGTKFESKKEIKVDKDAYLKMGDTNTNFSSEIFNKIVKNESKDGEIKKNIFFSPLSISLALSMVYNGAEGDTVTETGEALQFGGLSKEEINNGYKSLTNTLEDKSKSIELDIANALFGNKKIKFKKDFIRTIKDYYDGEYNSLDFNDKKSLKIINDWVYKNTKGKIKQIISDIDPSAILYLINAIYFNGKWKISFDKDETHDRTFTLMNGSDKEVKFMFSEGEYEYKEKEKYKAAKLPYGKEGSVNMYLFVPREEVDKNNFFEFLKLFDKENIKNTLSGFYTEYLDYLILPKFEFDYSKSLAKILKDMGMKKIFSGGANLSGIANGNPTVSKVIHKAYIKVNEEGTEAAAVTVVEMEDGCAPGGSSRKSVGVTADKPFVFIIRDDETNTILFMGVVTDPEKIDDK